MDKADLYWKYYEEQREQGRSFDTQRASIGYLVISVAGALLAFTASHDFALTTVPVLLFVAALGLYGIFATQKLYERQEYHYERARCCLEQLDRLVDPGVFMCVRAESDAQHYRSFKLATRMESRIVWIYLHAIAFLAGTGAIAYAIIKY
jgi:hypothetical protein